MKQARFICGATIVAGVSLAGISACSPTVGVTAGPSDLFEALSPYCGQAFEGRVAVDEPGGDTGWQSERLVMHVRECSDAEIRIPLHVGEDRSRTWVLTRTGTGFRLKHDHRHEDGSEDVLTQYGGDSASVEGLRIEFPADEFSRDLFLREGFDASVENTWLMQIEGVTFTYGLERPNRVFRAEFDLSESVTPPPAPWGFED